MRLWHIICASRGVRFIDGSIHPPPPILRGTYASCRVGRLAIISSEPIPKSRSRSAALEGKSLKGHDLKLIRIASHPSTAASHLLAAGSTPLLSRTFSLSNLARTSTRLRTRYEPEDEHFTGGFAISIGRKNIIHPQQLTRRSRHEKIEANGIAKLIIFQNGLAGLISA